MSGIRQFERMFSYDEWANREVLRVIPSAPSRSLELLSHILSAERLWWERIHQQTQTFPVWPNFTLDECERQVEEVSELWREYLAKLPEGGLSQIILYKNTFGESWSNTAEDILMHVYTHSAYHRGQIATNMREAGGTPAYTDFIHSIRQGFVE
jgi:uncharacterized damage-inducible protein DinB